MTVKSKEQAWVEANKIISTDYIYDTYRSEAAGHGIYFSTKEGMNEWISDLGNRLEVNLQDGTSVNIWIEEDEKEKREALILKLLATYEDEKKSINEAYDHFMSEAPVNNYGETDADFVLAMNEWHMKKINDLTKNFAAEVANI